MDTLTERAVRTLLFIAGLFTLPALAPDIPAAAVDDTIQHWTQNKYSRQAAARRAEEDAGAVHHSRVSR